MPSCFHSEVLNENEVKCQYFCTFITTNYDIRSWYYNSKTQEQEFFMRYLSIQQHFSWTATIPSPSSSSSQCGNFRIFLIPRFYVNSIMANLEGWELPFAFFVNVIRSPKSIFEKCQNAYFSEIEIRTKIDFT